jgi:Ca2+-binding RTX toxin-like protein
MSGTQFSDEFVSSADTEIFTGGTGSDVFVLGGGSGTDRITDFDKNADSIEILKNINDTSITEASSALSRVTDTSDGALINLGYTGTGSDQILHSILLEGISKEDLTASNFIVSEIL